MKINALEPPHLQDFTFFFFLQIHNVDGIIIFAKMKLNRNQSFKSLTKISWNNKSVHFVS